MLDDRSASWLAAHIGEVNDTFLRAMLWGAMWDLVRDARLAPTQFIATAVHELPNERDEQIAAGIVNRMTRATSSYLSSSQQAEIIGTVEAALLAGASDAKQPYGMRKNQLDAFISTARTPVAMSRLAAWLDSTSTVGIPLRQPTRWSIVTHLVERGAPNADAIFAAETRRDTSVNGRRSSFVAGAARSSAATKSQYFTRYFADTTLNEDWATASLRAFNAQDQAALTLPYLVPALDSLPWIQKNRRIFFLGSWLGGFIGGHKSAEALAEIDGFLRDHPNLPIDLKQKILQTRDDLERTVRIRAKYAATSGATSSKQQLTRGLQAGQSRDHRPATDRSM
jgi:aminopeptidase N